MFTPREYTVLDELIKGRTNKEIARTLNISPFTVRQHLQAIGIKLGHSNRLAIALNFINIKKSQVLHQLDSVDPLSGAISTSPKRCSPQKSTRRELSQQEVHLIKGGTCFVAGSVGARDETVLVPFLKATLKKSP